MMTLDQRRMLLYGLGAVGAVVIGKKGYQHLFVQGLSEDERKMLLRVGMSGAAVWALKTFVDLSFLGEYKQWIDPTGILTAGP